MNLLILLMADNFAEAFVQGVFKYGILGLIVYGISKLFSKNEDTTDKSEKSIIITPKIDSSQIPNMFSEREKASIIYILMLISGANGKKNSKKLEYSTDVSIQLGFNLEDNPELNVYQSKNADYAYSILKSFNPNQKLIFSVYLGHILKLESPTENEIRLVGRILEQCGISESEFDNTLSKLDSIMTKFYL